MTGPVSRIPAQRGPVEELDPSRVPVIPLAEQGGWHTPGVHRVRLGDREVWVRMDERGIVSVSSIGPDRLASRPLG